MRVCVCGEKENKHPFIGMLACSNGAANWAVYRPVVCGNEQGGSFRASECGYLVAFRLFFCFVPLLNVHMQALAQFGSVGVKMVSLSLALTVTQLMEKLVLEHRKVV